MPRPVQREALVLEVWREKKRDPIDTGIAQLSGYLARIGLDRCVLVPFDNPAPRRYSAPMARRFNTTGPCDEARHYMLPPLPRLGDARRHVENGDYFVLHAPRQTGKTTSIRELSRVLRESGKYAALYVSCEQAQSMEDDYAAAEAVLVHELRQAAEEQLREGNRPMQGDGGVAGTRVRGLLAAWTIACPLPIVLFLDEIDALRGSSLISVLRQLRAGFTSNRAHFPWSIVLCGMRDVRDYKAASGGDGSRLGSSSPFNIKVASLTLSGFTEEEVGTLYGQHTDETGQRFDGEAVSLAWELTRGQPWLVNALAREIIEEMAVPAGEPIGAEHVSTAKERLIQARATHLDSLIERLREERVRRVIQPILSGEYIMDEPLQDDISYARDLGLIVAEPGGTMRVANPIYREVIPRALCGTLQGSIDHPTAWYVRADGTLDFPALLRAFVEFWREHGEILVRRESYSEAASQLVLMAFLQRVVNGGGTIDREYGVGRGRIDLLVRWPYGEAQPGVPRPVQREALELKVWREKKRDPIDAGIAQLSEYLGRMGLDRGVLVLFDTRAAAPPWEERGTFEEREVEGRRLTVLRA